MENSASRLARERVMADLKTLATDAEALLRASADDVGDKTEDAREPLNAALEKAKNTYSDLQQRGVSSVKEAAETR